MTETKWNALERKLLRGEPVQFQQAGCTPGSIEKREIAISDARYGRMYSLRCIDDGNTILCTYSIKELRQLIID